MQKFVRWRRLVRTMTFSADAAALSAWATAGKPAASGSSAPQAFICPHIDLSAAERTGRLLAETIASASLYGEWSDHSSVSLKERLLEQLLQSKPPGKKETLESLMASFVASHRGVATRMAEAFSGSEQDQASLTMRVAEVIATFPEVERESYATIAIRRYHPELACAAVQQEHECEFRPALCSNAGCTERCSEKYLRAHLEVCAHRLVPCEKCSEVVKRGEMVAHASAACPMREAKCSFSAIGCEIPLPHAKLAEHLEGCTQAHLMLFMRRILEQEDQAKQMCDRIARLESQNRELVALRETDLQAQIAQRQSDSSAQGVACAQLAGLEAKIAAIEKRTASEIKELRKAIDDGHGKFHKKADDMDAEAKKRHDALEAHHSKNLETLRTDFAALRSSMADLHPLRDEIAVLRASLSQATQPPMPPSG